MHSGRYQAKTFIQYLQPLCCFELLLAVCHNATFVLQTFATLVLTYNMFRNFQLHSKHGQLFCTDFGQSDSRYHHVQVRQVGIKNVLLVTKTQYITRSSVIARTGTNLGMPGALSRYIQIDIHGVAHLELKVLYFGRSLHSCCLL